MALVLAGLLALGVAGCRSDQAVGGEPRQPRMRQVEPTPEQQQKIDEAHAAKDTGDYSTALALFQDILAENPTVTTAYLGIGDIYIIKKEWLKAEPAYARAAQLEPRNFDAQYGHGLALQMLERFLEAIRAYHRALSIRPDSAKANLSMATTYLQLGEPGSALAFAEKAVESDPSNAAAHANLGTVYQAADRNTDAIEQYQAALELMGDDQQRGPLMMNLIDVLGREQRYHEAANAAEYYVRLEPSPNGYERLGWARFRLAEYDRSMDAYRKAVELDPRHWPSLNGVGVNAINTWLLSKKRDTAAADEARRAFRASLRANPEQPKIVMLLSSYGL
jgi:tetratricopeptide (TPR) repeat protein